MFDVIDVTAEYVRLKGFSARHCRFENGMTTDKVAVNLYFDQTPLRSAGYLKNIRAEEGYVMRSSSIMNEVGKLNSQDLNNRFLNALKIPVQYDPWGEAVFTESGSGTEPGATKQSTSLICNNFNQIKPIDDPQDRLTDSCWSFLDLGTFDLTIRKSALPAKDYEFMTAQLIQKRQMLNAYLDKNPSLKKAYTEHRKQIDSVMSLLRLRNAGTLAYLLNLDLCSGSMKNESICKNQAKLIDILGQNYLDQDETGTTKNIFDRLSANRADSTFVPSLTYADLQKGSRMPLNDANTSLAAAEEIARAFAGEINMLLKNRTAIAIVKMKEMLAEQSKSTGLESLSPSVLMGTNFSVNRSTGSNTGFQFALFNAKHTVSDLSRLKLSPEDSVAGGRNVHGVTSYGTLRMAFPRDTQVVKFHPTDSGSLMSLAGVVPLMVLNTVDGVGTSGGTAIMALPDITDDDDTIGSTAVAKGSLPKGNSTTSRTPARSAAQVEVNPDSFSGRMSAACM